MSCWSRRAGVTAFLLLLWSHAWGESPEWTQQELKIIDSLRLGHLPVEKEPPAGALLRLGERLFFDRRLSANGKVACASCHRPGKHFSDGLPVAKALGTGARNTPSLVGASQRRWQTWDGRKDSVWSQSLAPLENLREHGISRVQVLRVISDDSRLRGLFEASFGALPALEDERRFPAEATPLGEVAAVRAWKSMSRKDQRQVNTAFAKVGRALAAYISTLRYAPTRFDRYADTLIAGEGQSAGHLSPEEQEGLRLFISQKSGCINCHNGPLFSHQGFSNIGTGSRADHGRSAGIKHLLRDPFNCLGDHADTASDCDALRYARRAGHDLRGAFLVPSLRGAGHTAPYMHDGRFASLEEVVAYYASNPRERNPNAHLPEIHLNSAEQRALVAFIKTVQ